MGGSSSKKRPVKVEPPQKDDVIARENEPDNNNVHLHGSHDQVDDVQDVPETVETVQPNHKKPETPKMDQNELHHSNKTLSFDKEDLIDSNKIVHLSSENSFPTPGSSPIILTKESFSPNNLTKTTRPPLQFDQNNTQITPSRRPPRPVVSDGLMTSSQLVTSSGLMTSSNRNQTSLSQSTRHFSANIASVGNGEGPENQFTKSQNFYKIRDQSGRYNSYSGSVENHTPSHFSGVYNRHTGDQSVKSGMSGNSDVASLLRKDKFSLLGSQLQQQESQIFSRSLQQTNGLTNGLTRSSAPSKPLPTFSSSAPFPAPSSTTYKFDPGKFRRVNESSTVFSTGRNGSVKKTGIGSGPLDERDEELIASIEREFDFSY